MNITMEGEYAYAMDPYTKVRILCVDRLKNYAPVVSMDTNGVLYSHRGCGISYPLSNSDFNLVPLKKKPVERWAVEVNGEFFSSYSSEEIARQRASLYENSRVLLMREVEE